MKGKREPCCFSLVSPRFAPRDITAAPFPDAKASKTVFTFFSPPSYLTWTSILETLQSGLAAASCRSQNGASCRLQPTREDSQTTGNFFFNFVFHATKTQVKHVDAAAAVGNEKLRKPDMLSLSGKNLGTTLLVIFMFWLLLRDHVLSSRLRNFWNSDSRFSDFSEFLTCKYNFDGSVYVFLARKYN